jgi:hypothetical protein
MKMKVAGQTVLYQNNDELVCIRRALQTYSDQRGKCAKADEKGQIPCTVSIVLSHLVKNPVFSE